MKRVVLLFLALLMVASLVGCGTPKPNEKFSADTVAALEAAIETFDAVLAYDMSMEDAEEKLERIYTTMDDSETYGSVVSSRIASATVRLSIISLYVEYSAVSGSSSRYDSGDMEVIREQRDGLYALLYGD